MLSAAVIGVLIGVVVGALGAGGGILSVPVLVYLLGQSPHDAAAGSLVIVTLTALVSIISPARAGRVKWKKGAIFAAVSIIGSVVGSRLSFLVAGEKLMRLFAVLLVCVAVIMIRKGIRARRDLEPDRRTVANPLMLVLAAIFTGLLTGFFGVGGGFAVVPMLIIALGFKMRDAAATSLLVMIVVSLTGLVSRIGTGVHIGWPVILIFAAASMFGGVIGGPLSAKVKSSTLTIIFGVLLAGVAVFTGVQTMLST